LGAPKWNCEWWPTLPCEQNILEAPLLTAERNKYTFLELISCNSTHYTMRRGERNIYVLKQVCCNSTRGDRVERNAVFNMISWVTNKIKYQGSLIR
jgi:hypothetical protein